MSKNALDWNFFSLIISLTIVRITPTFPFNPPPNVLQKTAQAKLLENPNPTELIPVPSSPTSSTRFRPAQRESLTRPHSTAVTNWANVKQPCRMPTWEEMAESWSEGSKDRSW